MARQRSRVEFCESVGENCNLLLPATRVSVTSRYDHRVCSSVDEVPQEREEKEDPSLEPRQGSLPGYSWLKSLKILQRNEIQSYRHHHHHQQLTVPNVSHTFSFNLH